MDLEVFEPETKVTALSRPVIKLMKTCFNIYQNTENHCILLDFQIIGSFFNVLKYSVVDLCSKYKDSF